MRQPWFCTRCDGIIDPGDYGPIDLAERCQCRTLAEQIELRRSDPEFLNRIEMIKARFKDVLDRLADS